MKIEAGSISTEINLNEPALSSLENSANISMHHQMYREMEDKPVQDFDLLSSIEHNLKMLEDLQARHSFMSREIRYLLKID